MSTTTASLIYQLKADGSQLSRELSKSRKGFEGFKKSARRSINVAGKAVAGLVTGIGALTLKANQAIDDLQKMGDSAGLASEDMGTLELTAELGGSSIESLGKAFGRLSRNMKDNPKLFRELGVEVRNASGEMRPTMDVVEDVADRIQELGPGAESTALAMETFGRAGQELIPTLLQGSEGLARNREEAERLGLTFDEKTGRAAEAFNDDLSRLKLAQRGLFRQVAGEIIPVFSRYAEGLLQTNNESSTLATFSKRIAQGFQGLLSIVDGVRGAVTMFATLISTPFKVLFAAIEGVVGHLAIVGDEFGRVFTAIVEGNFRDLVDAPGRAFSRVEQNASVTAGKIGMAFSTTFEEIEAIAWDVGGSLENIWDDSGDAADRSLEKLSAVPKAIGDIKPKSHEAAEGIKALDDAMAAVDRAWGDAQAEQERYFASLEQEGQRVFQSPRTEAEQMQAELDRLNLLLREGVISQDTFARAMRQATQGLRDEKQAVEDTADEVGALEKGFSEFGRGAAGALFSEFEGGLFDPFNASVADMVQNFIQGVGRMAFRAATANIIGSLFGGAAGGGSVVAAASGGLIRGPGTATSDSIPARLSNGEYVVRAAAVRNVGVDRLNAINAMSAPSRFADGGAVAAGQPDVNLTVVNVKDDKDMERYLSTAKGERVVMNIVTRNS